MGKSASQYGHCECRKTKSVWWEWVRGWVCPSSAGRDRSGNCFPTIVGDVAVVMEDGVVGWSNCRFWVIWIASTAHRTAMITYRVVLALSRVMGIRWENGGRTTGVVVRVCGMDEGSAASAAVVRGVAATAASARTIPVESGPPLPLCPQETASATTRRSPVRARGSGLEGGLCLCDFERGEDTGAQHRQDSDQDHSFQEWNLTMQFTSPLWWSLIPDVGSDCHKLTGI